MTSTARKSALTGLVLVAFGALALPAAARDHDRGWGHDRGGHERSAHVRQYDRRYDRRDAYRHGDRDGYRYRNDRRVVYRPVTRGPIHRNHYRPPPRVVYRPPARVVYRPPARVVYRPAPRVRWTRGARYYGPGYGPTYVVNDYYGYGLRQPPRGYYWRRSDLGDFLLVAAATGIIADLVLHH